MFGLSKILSSFPDGIPKGEGWRTYELTHREDFTLDMIKDYLKRLENWKSNPYSIKLIKSENLVKAINFSNELVSLYPNGIPDGKGGYLPWPVRYRSDGYKFGLEFLLNNQDGLNGEPWDLWYILEAVEQSGRTDFIEVLELFGDKVEVDLSSLINIMSRNIHDLSLRLSELLFLM